MKLKNNALQRLFNGLVNFKVEMNPVVAVYDLFKACDDEMAIEQDMFVNTNLELTKSVHVFERKLKAAEKDIEMLKKQNEHLRHEVSVKDKRNNELQKQLLNVIPDHTDESAKKEIDFLRTSRLEWAKRAIDRRKERDDARAKCEKLEADCKATLELNDKILKQNTEFVDKLQAATDARDHLRAELEAKVKRLDEITKDRDFYYGLYTELRKDYDKLFEDKRKYYIEQCNKILKSTPNSIYGRNCYDQGQTDLWVKLQNVKDMQPNEFDVECECLGDVIDMDLEDFLDAYYKKWEEENKTERMRKWLGNFCFGRECKGCPLESKEYKCGCGYSFRRADRFDTRIIPDEDIKRYYEKVRGCGRWSFSNDISEKIKEAENKTNKWLISMDSWECTLEGTIEVNKDLLEKVCGVKPDKKDHQLEYGDAVRLPWRDYDYMYIEPTEKGAKNVRLFDPKNHAVVVTHISNAKYNRGKIILTSEEDLRKIWKNTK